MEIYINKNIKEYYQIDLKTARKLLDEEKSKKERLSYDKNFNRNYYLRYFISTNRGGI